MRTDAGRFEQPGGGDAAVWFFRRSTALQIEAMRPPGGRDFPRRDDGGQAGPGCGYPLTRVLAVAGTDQIAWFPTIYRNRPKYRKNILYWTCLAKNSPGDLDSKANIVLDANVKILPLFKLRIERASSRLDQEEAPQGPPLPTLTRGVGTPRSNKSSRSPFCWGGVSSQEQSSWQIPG